ncbi:MAG: radical SAM protein [Muribaculaceae bacterium]|nr:radical SAM protein [Muribaculaceae bacterium]
MYTISIYTYWFKDNGCWYLYNAQSNFFSRVSAELISILQDREWQKCDEETIKFLLTHHVIEHTGEELDYYYTKLLRFNSVNYNPTSLGLVIAPTTACNFDCPYCFEPKKNPKVMSDDTIDKLIEFIHQHGQTKKLKVTWYGGEPLLAFTQIKKIIIRLKEEGLPEISNHRIVTNGSLITEEICDFFRIHKLHTMQITFDGVRETHDRTRCFKANRAPSFDLIYKNLHLVRKFIPECNINLRINVNKENLDDYVLLHKIIRKDFPQDPNIWIYPGLIREETQDGCSFKSSCITSTDLVDFYTYLRSRGLDEPLFPEHRQFGCMMHAKNSYIIGPEGEIYKCWNDVTCPEKVVGNISSPNRKISSLQLKYMVGASPFREECKHCGVFPVCDGPCGYYQYKNVFEGGRYNMCSALKNPENLRKALLEGYLTKITGAIND